MTSFGTALTRSMSVIRAPLLLAVLAGSLLSGCTAPDKTTATPADLRMSATWTDDGQHMDVDLRNAGGTSMNLGGMNMTMTAPNGTMIPIHWSGMAPMLGPGKSMSFELHSMMMQDGTMGMTMDHAMAGTHMPMPSGDYMLRIGSTTTMVAQSELA